MDSRTIVTAGLTAAFVIAVGFASFYLAVLKPQQRQAELDRAVALPPAAEPSARPARDASPDAAGAAAVSAEPEAGQTEPAPAEPEEIYIPAPPTPARTLTAPQGQWVVDEYLSRQSTNDIAWILDLYGPRVRYYRKGRVGHGAIRADKRAYFGRWPSRTNTLASGIRLQPTGDGTATLRFDYDFTVAGGGRSRSGRAWAELDVADGGTGSYRIVGERGGVY